MIYKIKNMDSVVIGSRTADEYAFQICNFLTMLYNNIEKESETMTNKVIKHNLFSYINQLHNFDNQTELSTNRFNFFYKEIEEKIDLILKIFKKSKDFDESTKKIDNEVKKQLKEKTVDRNKKICKYLVDDCFKIISTCMFDKEYFEKI